MYIKEDNSYNSMIEKSALYWLEQLAEGEDLVNRQSARLTKEYIANLQKRIQELEKGNALKDEFLRRLKVKSRENK